MNFLTTLASSPLAAYTLNLLLALTVIGLSVLLAARLLFRRDPAARHFLCLLGLIALLLTPAVVGLETQCGSGLFKLALPGSAPVEVATTEPVLTYSDKPYRVAISPIVEAQASFAWGGWVLGTAYLLGVGWGALRFAHGYRRVMRLKRQLSPWREPTAGATLHAVEKALHMPVPPVYTSRHVASPLAVGLLRPAVILPEGLAETLTPRQLRHVLLHECAHITFRHGLGGLLERIANVLFWPHPLVRLLCRELACAREEMCDNVASQEDGAACYARTLLSIAQGFDRAPNLSAGLALLGTGTSLEARITGLLDPRRNRMVSVKRWKLWAVTGATVVAMASTAAVRVVAAQEKPGQIPGGILPNDSAVTRVFEFQYVDANQAATVLRNSLPLQQLSLLQLAVDSRTNSLIVQCSGEQMVGVATLFGRLEQLAAEADAQPAPIPSPIAPTVTPDQRMVSQSTFPSASSTRSHSTTYSTPLPAQQTSSALQKKADQRIKSQVVTAARKTALVAGKKQSAYAAKLKTATVEKPILMTVYVNAVTGDANFDTNTLTTSKDNISFVTTTNGPIQMNATTSNIQKVQGKSSTRSIKYWKAPLKATFKATPAQNIEVFRTSIRTRDTFTPVQVIEGQAIRINRDVENIEQVKTKNELKEKKIRYRIELDKQPAIEKKVEAASQVNVRAAAVSSQLAEAFAAQTSVAAEQLQIAEKHKADATRAFTIDLALKEKLSIQDIEIKEQKAPRP